MHDASVLEGQLRPGPVRRGSAVLAGKGVARGRRDGNRERAQEAAAAAAAAGGGGGGGERLVERLVGDERERLRARRGRAGGFLRGDLAARQRGVDGDGPVRGQDHEGVDDRARADDESALEQARRGHRAGGDPDRDRVHRPEGDVQSEVVGFPQDEPDVERASAARVVADGIDDVTVDGHRARRRSLGWTNRRE